MKARLLVLVLLVLPVVSFAEEEATVTILVFREEAPGERVPLVGARVTVWTEDTRPVNVASRFVAETKSDEFGVATVRVAADRDYHWHVEAKGFGIYHEYGTAARFEDGDIVLLTSGRDYRIRFLAPFGGPLANARVEMYLGCSHSAAARVATTDADGIAVLENVSDYGWDLWVNAPGVDPGPYSLPAALPSGPPSVVITEWGATATGTVVDEAGKPVAGATVRELDGFRGPVTATDAKGAFVLHGLSGKAEIGVFLPGTAFEQRPVAVARAFTEDVPLRFVLEKDRPTSLGDGEVRHRLDIVIEKGDSFVPIRIVRLSDGLTMKRGSGFYTTTFDVPEGRYRITAGGGFSFEAETTTTVNVPSPGHEAVRIEMTVQQTGFGVRYDSSQRKGKGELRIPGATKDINMNAIVWIPADAPAALYLTTPHERLVPVPPEEKGNRFLTLPTAEPSRIRFRLTDAKGEALVPQMDADIGKDGMHTIETHDSGEVDLTFSAKGFLDRQVLVTLPPPPAALDLGTIVLHRPSEAVVKMLTVLTADGEPVEEPGIRTEEDSYDEAVIDVIKDVPAAIFAEGYLPLPVVLTRKGPDEFRFPAGVVEIEAKDASVWLDGWLFESENGRVVIRGVPAGRHRLTIIEPGATPRSRMVEVR